MKLGAGIGAMSKVLVHNRGTVFGGEGNICMSSNFFGVVNGSWHDLPLFIGCPLEASIRLMAPRRTGDDCAVRLYCFLCAFDS